MKLIVAIIQPQQLPAVKRSLFAAKFRHLTCTNVLGTAHEGAELMVFRGVPHEVSLFQKVRIEIAVKEESVKPAVEAIEQGSRESGGFGVIFVTELHDMIHIRTGERGEKAIR